MKTNTRIIGSFACAAAFAASSFAALNSPFESLPGETIAAFRFDNSSETIEEYVESTKMGQLMFSDEKIAEYKALIEAAIASDEDGDSLLNKLGEVGLELDDLYEMISSHIGAAVVDWEVPGHLSMPTVLVWAEMSDGVAERAFQAVLDGSAENEGIERIDLELPGGPGARIRDLSDGSSFLIAQLEDRFLFAIGNVREPITDMEAAKVFEEAELEALGQFMAAQAGSGGEFLSEFYSDPGVSSVRPSYKTRLEVLGNAKRLLDFVPPQSRQGLEAVNIDAFTKIGIWSGFVEMEERSVVFLGAPAPREGIAQLFENEFFEFQPPAWVPSSVNTYTAASFDMMKLYDFALDTAKKFMPPEQVEQQVAMGNAQLQMTLQTDIPTLLSSFGNRIHMIEYPIEIVSMDVGGSSSVEIPQASQAVVMDFTRPEILQAGMAMVGAMAQNPNGGMELVDEMGFSGIRVPQPGQGSMTIAHGLGKLVMTIGNESTSSRIFSALSNLPEGEDALMNDPELRNYMSEAGVKPGMVFSYSQGDKMLKNLVPVLKSVTANMRVAAGEEGAELMEQLVDLIPSEEELEGLLGIAFNRMYYNEAGIVLEGVNQYK